MATNYVGARETRAMFQPSPAQRKMLNRSLQVKPFGTLLTTESGNTKGYRVQAVRLAPSQMVRLRGEITGEYYARSMSNGGYIKPGTTGVRMLKNADSSIKIRASVAPGGKDRPIPPAGSSGHSEAAAGKAGISTPFLIIAGLLAIAILR